MTCTRRGQDGRAVTRNFGLAVPIFTVHQILETPGFASSFGKSARGGAETRRGRKSTNNQKIMTEEARPPMQLERQLQALEARLGEKLRHEREAIVSALRRELRGGGGTTRATARPSEHSASSAAATTAPSACALATPRTIGFASGCRSAASPPAAPEPSSSASLDSAHFEDAEVLRALERARGGGRPCPDSADGGGTKPGVLLRMKSGLLRRGSAEARAPRHGALAAFFKGKHRGSTRLSGTAMNLLAASSVARARLKCEMHARRLFNEVLPVLQPDGMRRQSWDAALAACVLWCGIVVPLRVAFHDELGRSVALDFFDGVADAAYWADVGLNLRTGFYTGTPRHRPPPREAAF